jgi:hypothetical protein
MPPIDQISLLTANFGNADSFGATLDDWFQFIGGRPAEVIVVDCTDCPTQSALYDLYLTGKIDKLQLVRPGMPENGKEFCFYREHLAAASATQPYLLFFKSDTLPYQNKFNWLQEALDDLERPEIFGITGSFNVDSRYRDDRAGWYLTKKCSENFALMKRSMFIDAMEWFAGGYISSGFRGLNPAASTGQARFLIEVAFERYMDAHGLFCLARREDPDWTVFHTNVSGERLSETRARYLQRKDIVRCMNARNFNAKVGGCYYGQFLDGRLHELSCRFGRQALARGINAIRQRIELWLNQSLRYGE